MLSSVISITLFALGLAACGVIAASWLRQTPAIARLRRELAECSDTREMRFTVTTIEVRSSASVYYPDFGGMSGGTSSVIRQTPRRLRSALKLLPEASAAA